MKTITLFLAIILFTQFTNAQQKEKIKGSKIVTIAQLEIGSFDQIEVSDNIELFLIKGDECGIEIEADENLHDLFVINIHGGILFISSKMDVTNSKKFSLRITYTDKLSTIIARNESTITALDDVILPSIIFKAYDSAKIFANVKSKIFSLIGDDKSKTELNITSEQTFIELSKGAQLKSLISTTEMKCDLYQKSVAIVEGDVINLKLQMDNNSTFTGKNLNAKMTDLKMEGYTNCSILSSSKIAIDASGKAAIQLYGEQEIQIKHFIDSAVLSKKLLK